MRSPITSTIQKPFFTFYNAYIAISSVATQTVPVGVAAETPLAQKCGPQSSSVVCVDKYASVMPNHFYRQASTNGTYAAGVDDFRYTMVPNDTSFGLIKDADFVVFDRERGLKDVLGENPVYDFMFEINDGIHEAPVWSPATNAFYFSNEAPDAVTQFVINLNEDPPTLETLVTDPPLYGLNGGTIYNGTIYWATAGGKVINGTEYRAGIYSMDPLTNKTTVLLNNYFGYNFLGLDDLFVDDKGDVWFTADDYGFFIGLTDTPPQFMPGTFRFRPSTGAVNLVDNTMLQPNGIAISPPTSPCSSSITDFSARKIYISDTGAFSGPVTGPPAPVYNTTGPRTVYSFDMSKNGLSIGNRKPIYLAPNYIPDGLKVAGNGFLVTAAGKGVDVLDEEGTLLVRVQTNFTVNNFGWSGVPVPGDAIRGENYTTLWLTGQGGVGRVRWALAGQELY